MKGYTLLELIVCLAISTILITIAIPSWRFIHQQQQITAITKSLIHTINYTHTQAILRKQILTICPLLSDDKLACGNQWQQGWQILTPQNYRLRYITNPTRLMIAWRDLRHTNQIKIFPNSTAEGSNGSFYYGTAQLTLNRGGRIRQIH